ncbi:MAG TPA: hypothetical protein VN631_12640 [Negativicutes bacterium]|nr:hypothetical protein [Negativicutes bacterium]
MMLSGFGQLSYRDRMVKLGIITVSAAIVANFIPAIYLWWAYDVIPPLADILKIWSAAAAAFGVSWIVQPLSFFAVLGTAGAYISWVAGTVGQLRVPASVMAQKAAEVESGTAEGDVVSTIGIATSVFVSVGIVTFFIFVGSWVIPMLPVYVTKTFKYILPAVFGALFFDLSEKYLNVGISTFLAALVITYAKGPLGIPYWVVGILIIASGILLARIFYKMSKK